MIPLSFEVLVIIAVIFTLIGGQIVLNIAKVFSHFFNPSYHNPGLSTLPAAPSDGSSRSGGSGNFGLVVVILLFTVMLFFSWDLWSVILFGNKQQTDPDFKTTVPITYTSSSPNGGIKMEKDEVPIDSDYYFSEEEQLTTASSDYFSSSFECLGFVVQIASGSNIEFVKSEKKRLEKRYDAELQLAVGIDGNYKILFLKTYSSKDEAAAAKYYFDKDIYIAECSSIDYFYD